MPFLKNGGLFLLLEQAEQSVTYEFKQNVCLLIQLPEDLKRYFCIATIAWLSPIQPGSVRSGGIGLHFDSHNSDIRLAIEAKLSTCKSVSVPSPMLQ